MTGLLQAIFVALSNFFSYSETSKEHQAETDIIKDKKKLKKCSDISEDILILAVKYRTNMTPQDQRKLLRLIKRFKQNN